MGLLDGVEVPRVDGCCPQNCVCSMAWRFTKVSRVDASRRVDRAYHTQVLQDKDQQIDINRKKAVDVMRACFKPILPDQGAKLLHRVQNSTPT